MHTSTRSRGRSTAPVKDAKNRSQTPEALVTKAHIELVDSYLGDLDWRIKENSNSTGQQILTMVLALARATLAIALAMTKVC